MWWMLVACGPTDATVTAGYASARRAVEEGRCDDALAVLPRVIQHGTELPSSEGGPSLALAAGRLATACSTVPDLPAIVAGDPAAALDTLLGLAHTLEGTAYADRIVEHVQAVWSRASSVDELASPRLCPRWQQVAAMAPEPLTQGPRFLEACAFSAAANGEGDPNARGYFRDFLVKYPFDANTTEMQAAYALETMELVEQQPTAFDRMERPAGLPFEGTTAMVRFANATDTPMEVMVLGEAGVLVERIDACSTCADAPDPCAGRPPTVIAELPAGAYRVVVEVDTARDRLSRTLGVPHAPEVRPSQGAWTLEPSTMYLQCFTELAETEETPAAPAAP